MARNQTLQAVQRGPPNQDDSNQAKAPSLIETTRDQLAHELLHHGPNRQETSRRMRETQAEAVAYVVNTAIGLDTNTASSDYNQLYQGNKETLAKSLHTIRQAANTILAALFLWEGLDRPTQISSPSIREAVAVATPPPAWAGGTSPRSAE